MYTLTLRPSARMLSPGPALILLLLVYGTLQARPVLAAPDQAPYLSPEAAQRAAAVSDAAPVLQPISSMRLRAGTTADQAVFAQDPDGGVLTFSKGAGPSFLSVTTTRFDGLAAEGNVHLAPSLADAQFMGTASVAVSDGFLIDQRSFEILVGNFPPIMDDPGEMVVFENGTADETLRASDLDGDKLTFSLPQGPAFASIVAESDTTATLHLAPGFSDAGEYSVSVSVTDGSLFDTRSVFVLVNDVDRRPSLAQPQPMTVRAGETADQAITATDADENSIHFQRYGNEPRYLSVTTTDAGAGTATGNIHLAPLPSDAPSADSVTVVTQGIVQASDGLLSDRKPVSITASFPVDRPPVLDQPADMTVAESESADQALHASDPDGDPLSYSMVSGPEFVAVYDADVALTPGFTDAGEYTAVLRAADSRGLSDEKSLHIQVIQRNAPPDLEQPSAMIAFAGQTATQEIHATDIDGDSLRFVAIAPSYMTVVTSITGPGSATGQIRLNPASTDIGRIRGTIAVTDGLLYPQRDFDIEVHPPGTPVLSRIPDECIHPGEKVTIAIHAIDPEGSPLAISQSGLPSYGTFLDNGDGTATLTLTLSASEPSGTTFMTVRASDGVLSDLQLFAINIAPAFACPGEGFHWNPPFLSYGGDNPPIALTSGPYSGVTGVATLLDGSRSYDPEGQRLSYGWNFGDGQFALGPTPAHVFAAPGTYSVTLLVSDGAATSRRFSTATIADAFPARAFGPPGQMRLKLWTGRPTLCLQIEPVNGSYLNADVDVSSLVLKSPGTGSVDQISAISGKTLTIEDRDENGIGEISACFAREDLLRLFSGITGQQTVSVAIEATVGTGGKLRARVDLTVEANRHGPATVSPNPLNPISTLSFTTALAGPLRILLYTVDGRLVGKVHDERAAPAGDHQVLLDGRGAGGEKLPSGVYFYRIESADGVTTGRFAILR